MKKNLLKIMIVIVIIIIIVLLILTNIYNKDSEEDESSEISYEEAYDETNLEMDDTSFQLVTLNSEYYGVLTIIDNICEYANMAYNENYLSTTSYLDEELTDEDKQVYVEIILDMLSEDYMVEFNITEDNLQEKFSVLIQEEYSVNTMYYSTRENNMCIFLIYGELKNSNTNYNFMVAVDLDSGAYEIYLDDFITKNDYVEDNINSLKIENDKITLNENNEYTIIDYSNQDMAQKYLSNYKEILLDDLEKAYNLLDSEYRELKFENYEEFEEYYEDRKNNIFSCSLASYNVTSYDSYMEYVCLDTSGNCYTFYAIATMNYTIRLDDYTILSDDYIELYNSATDEEKIQTDIEMFFKMINTKDYNAAYEILNDTFKTNNFATVDEFKEYAQNDFFDNTTITTVTDLTESGGYYVCTITTTNTSDTSETGEETFIVSLGEGTDFELSFTVKE